jgi:hypothetical protein
MQLLLSETTADTAARLSQGGENMQPELLIVDPNHSFSRLHWVRGSICLDTV